MAALWGMDERLAQGKQGSLQEALKKSWQAALRRAGRGGDNCGRSGRAPWIAVVRGCRGAELGWQSEGGKGA